MAEAPADPPAVRRTSFADTEAIELAAGGYSARFLPEVGMLGASLTYAGEEYLSLHGGVDAYRQHHTTGLPLLHPWANRLARFTYAVGGTWVDIDAAPPVNVLDGLPIHGTMLAAAGWQVEAEFADSTRAMLQARYPFGEHPDQLRSFPFPHDLVVFVELSDLGLRVTTTVSATGTLEVPVSFGWHPYFVLPGVERRELAVVLPDREHLGLDGRMLPTGESKHEAAATTVLGDGARAESFDDAYRLTTTADADPEAPFVLDELGHRPHRTLAIEAAAGARAGLRLAIELDETYPCAQVYAPEGAAFVALEPMTAPVNALVSGDHRVVPPGESFSASFVVRVEDPSEKAEEP